jgi:hypothetical protein
MPREGERREENDNAAEDSFAKYVEEAREKYGKIGELEEGNENTANNVADAKEEETRHAAEGQGPWETDFEAYVRELSEKYGDAEGREADSAVVQESGPDAGADSTSREGHLPKGENGKISLKEVDNDGGQDSAESNASANQNVGRESGHTDPVKPNTWEVDSTNEEVNGGTGSDEERGSAVLGRMDAGTAESVRSDTVPATVSETGVVSRDTNHTELYQHKTDSEIRGLNSFPGLFSGDYSLGPSGSEKARWNLEPTGTRADRPMVTPGDGSPASNVTPEWPGVRGRFGIEPFSKDHKLAASEGPSLMEPKKTTQEPESGDSVRDDSRSSLFVAHEKKSGESNYLPIPKEYLTSFEKDDVLKARIRRDSEPGKEYQLFTTPAFVDPHINIYHLKPTPRETFHVMSLERYGYSNFAKDFNNLRPRDFANVKLSYSDDMLVMQVNSNAIEIKQPKLVCEGGFVALEGILVENKPSGKIRIGRRFDSFDMHFNDAKTSHPRIIAMKAAGSRIEIWHRVSRNEPDHRLRCIPAIPLDNRDRIGERIEKSRLLVPDRSGMTKKEIRAWIDTEGHLFVPKKKHGSSSPRLDCSQKRGEPLGAYVKGIHELTGVVAKIKKQNDRGQLVAVVDDIEGIARVIAAVGAFRTPQRIEQVRRFMLFLTRERETAGRRRVIERARKLLGL